MTHQTKNDWIGKLLQDVLSKEELTNTLQFTFKGGPRINVENELIYLNNGKQENFSNPYDKIRWGNIVYYEDIPGCGYPVCINKGFWTQVMVDCFSFNVIVISGCDRFRGSGKPSARHKPMFYRCDQFFADNSHLNVKESDVPKQCEWIHQFQNWYEDTYGEQPKIYRGDRLMNTDYFKNNFKNE